MKEKIFIVKNKFRDKYKTGFPLLHKDYFFDYDQSVKEGEIIKVVDEDKRAFGRAYYGIQNKGIGWLITKDMATKIDEDFFEKIILEAMEKRKKFFKSKSTNTFRVFNGEGDGIGGLTIDYFDGFYLINWYSKGIFKFREIILNVFKKSIEYKGIYQKKRFDDAGKYIESQDFVMGEEAPAPLLVKENDVTFAIYLDDGAMVGIFLDQKDVRKAIRDKYAKGKSVLNTFSYTGAFSVYAALGGAKKTTNVDLANRSYAKTIEQFAVNGIDYEAQDIIVEDVFHYFKYATKKNLKFDMVILDPPSFAKSKKFKFSASKDYTKLLIDAISITEKNGIIVASTNCSSFNMLKYKGFVEEAFKTSKKKYKIVEEFMLPGDFVTKNYYKEGNYLKVLFLEVLN
ncbi:MAG: class I SAM-dependent rRNA methyltransferase [Acidaminobacteraceae bacterium]